MKLAILSDAHGNKFFFDQCMDEAKKRKPDRIVFLGDIFGYLKSGIEILQILIETDAEIIKGNHEAMLLGEIELDKQKDEVYKLAEQRKLLSNEEVELIKNLPQERILCIDNKKILFIHGAPWDHTCGYLYENTENFGWDDSDYDYIFMGHTHRPFVKSGDKTTYVNVGSCGLPRDVGLSPSFCLFDTKTESCEIFRLSLDKSILNNSEFEGIHPSVMKVFLR